jgi:hypothetical protein
MKPKRTVRIALTALFAVALLALAGCGPQATSAPFKHVAGMDCASCHKVEQALWASANDLHSASARDVLDVTVHNTDEVPKDDCLLCHAMFQAVQYHAVVDPTGTVPGGKIARAGFGGVDDRTQTFYSGAISHFITPVTATGPWTVTNAGDWKATKCEVCHDPASKDLFKLAKYGAWLDSQPKSAYIALDSGMPVAYNYVFSKGSFVKSDYVKQTAISVHATKLCDSCHDPDDQGGDPARTIGSANYGPQGGDSRSYVTASHADLGCIDCHTSHDFTPESATQAMLDVNCIGFGCHNRSTPLPKSPSDPGVVHVNHLP